MNYLGNQESQAQQKATTLKQISEAQQLLQRMESLVECYDSISLELGETLMPFCLQVENVNAPAVDRVIPSAPYFRKMDELCDRLAGIADRLRQTKNLLRL